MADIYDVAPDGTETQIAHGGVIADLRKRVPSRSWKDGHGRLIRPYFALHADHAITPDKLYRYAVPIQPTFWALAAGHRIRLRLAAQPDPSVCLSNGAKVVARVIGCLPRPSTLTTLAGGEYTIRAGGHHRSSVNLPLMPRRAFATVRSGATPTSDSVVLPLDWSSSR
jgi:predicted acyl esterase